MSVPAAVHLYVADPAVCDDPEVARRTLSLLTIEERRRHDAFRFDVHRREYLATRALALGVLAAWARADPADLRFERNEFGCPRLASHRGIHFNLTNATTLVACLVSSDGPVGVDLEPIARADDIIEVADTVFAKRELAELRALPSLEARRDRALDLWTLKEAYIKARGMGLALDLAGFAFGFADDRPPRVEVEAALGADGSRWCFSNRDMAGHRVSTCIDTTHRADHVPVVHVRRVVPFVDEIRVDRIDAA